MSDQVTIDLRTVRSAADGVALSVVIPIRNEEAILWENLRAVAACFDEVVGRGRWRFILVDNGSTDSTPEIIDRALEAFPLSRKLFVGEPNYGKAVRAGVDAADTDWVHVIDVEQWDLPFFRWSWRYRDRYDLFVASKRADPAICQQPIYRRFLSWGLNSLLQLFFAFPGSETHGPKLINRVSLGPILQKCVMDRGQYDTEIVLRAVRASLWIVELPVPYAEVRPTRSFMMKKIFYNLRAFNRLRKTFRSEPPQTGPVRLHRFCREDVLAQVAPPKAVEVSEPGTGAATAPEVQRRADTAS